MGGAVDAAGPPRDASGLLQPAQVLAGLFLVDAEMVGNVTRAHALGVAVDETDDRGRPVAGVPGQPGGAALLRQLREEVDGYPPRRAAASPLRGLICRQPAR